MIFIQRGVFFFFRMVYRRRDYLKKAKNVADRAVIRAMNFGFPGYLARSARGEGGGAALAVLSLLGRTRRGGVMSAT